MTGEKIENMIKKLPKLWFERKVQDYVATLHCILKMDQKNSFAHQMLATYYLREDQKFSTFNLEKRTLMGARHLYNWMPKASPKQLKKEDISPAALLDSLFLQGAIKEVKRLYGGNARWTRELRKRASDMRPTRLARACRNPARRMLTKAHGALALARLEMPNDVRRMIIAKLHD